MADMFGSPLGQVAFDESRANSVRTAVNAEEALGRIALQPAAGRKLAAEAEGAELDNSERKRMAELMSGMFSGGGQPEPGMGAPQQGKVGDSMTSLADKFNRMAMAAAGAGMTKQSQELAKTASTLTQQAAATSLSETRQRTEQLKAIGARAGLMGQLFGGAKSPEDWTRANAIYEFQTGEASPYRGVNYNPELVNTIATQAVEVKDRIAAEDRRLVRDETKRHNRATESNAAANLEVRKAEAQITKEREERLARAGGGTAAAGAPTREEMSQVKSLLTLDGVDTTGINADSVRTTTFAIASRAREIQQTNRAVGRAQAIQQAFNEAKANGELAVEASGGVQAFDTRFGGEKRFAGKQEKNTKETAVALPPEQSKWKVGNYYKGKDGRIGRWTGKGFEVD